MVDEPSYLVLGAGRIFFDRFAPGTKVGEGEIWFGNATDFSINRDIAFADKYASIGGVRTIVRSVPVEERQTFRLTCDAINHVNVSMWFGGETSFQYQDPLDLISESVVVRRGRYYQLGLSARPFIGLRNVDYVTVKIGATEIPPAGNFDIDKDAGRLQVLPSAVDIDDGDTLAISFQPREARRQAFLKPSAGNSVEGSLRFVSENLYGPNKVYLFPYVKLTPGRDISLIQSSQWQSIDFAGEAYRLNAVTQFHLVDEYDQVGLTFEEYAIVDLGDLSLSDFRAIEDELNRIINIDMPNNLSGA
jgi:hypothetical protein